MVANGLLKGRPTNNFSSLWFLRRYRANRFDGSLTIYPDDKHLVELLSKWRRAKKWYRLRLLDRPFPLWIFMIFDLKSIFCCFFFSFIQFSHFHFPLYWSCFWSSVLLKPLSYELCFDCRWVFSGIWSPWNAFVNTCNGWSQRKLPWISRPKKNVFQFCQGQELSCLFHSREYVSPAIIPAHEFPIKSPSSHLYTIRLTENAEAQLFQKSISEKWAK